MYKVVKLMVEQGVEGYRGVPKIKIYIVTVMLRGKLRKGVISRERDPSACSLGAPVNRSASSPSSPSIWKPMLKFRLQPTLVTIWFNNHAWRFSENSFLAPWRWYRNEFYDIPWTGVWILWCGERSCNGKYSVDMMVTRHICNIIHITSI